MPKRYRFKKVIQWVVINTVAAALCVAGVWFEIAWAGNLFKFLMWFIVAVYLIAAAAKACNTPTFVEQKRAGNLGHNVPPWISIAYDVLVTVLLAACGWFFYATLNVIQAYLCGYITADMPDEIDTNEVEILLGRK